MLITASGLQWPLWDVVGSTDVIWSQLSNKELNLLKRTGHVMHQQFNLLKRTGHVMHQQFNLLKTTGHVMHQQFNLLKPTGYVMHQQFNLLSLPVTWCTNSLTF